MSIPTDLVKQIVPISTLKVVAVTILSVMGVILLALTMFLFSELKDTKEKYGELKETNASLARDLDLIRIGGLAMTAGKLLSDEEKADLDKKVKDTRTTLKLKELEINKSNAPAEEKVRQKSQARMDSVWTLYCQIQPTNVACQPGGVK